jgi:hypothetical protein
MRLDRPSAAAGPSEGEARGSRGSGSGGSREGEIEVVMTERSIRVGQSPSLSWGSDRAYSVRLAKGRFDDVTEL